MGAGPFDIATMLRQKQILDQMQQTTGQGTQAAMLQPGINQFNMPDSSGGGAATGQIVPSPAAPAAPSGASANPNDQMPGVRQAQGLGAMLNRGINTGLNKVASGIQGLFTKPQPTVVPYDPALAQAGIPPPGLDMKTPGGGIYTPSSPIQKSNGQYDPDF